jgi:hypothetical protein
VSDLPAWKLVTNEDQWARFVEDVPSGEAPVFRREDFLDWAKVYLDSDPASRNHDPAAVKTPTGPLVEILRAWHGELAWNPADLTAPVAIIRGAWDGLVTDADAHWLFNRLTRSAERRDIKISRATHLMHLEEMRTALWCESIAFLLGDTPSCLSKGKPAMEDHHEAKDLPGYNPGSPDVAKSPITLEELKELKASCLFADEDMVYLRLSYDVLKDQVEDLVAMWRRIIAQHTHLAQYSWDRDTGKPDKEYGASVGKRFAQWVLDTERAQYDQEWLDYQYEIGLRHHRTKKNKTDHVNTAPHIRGRDLIGFAAATVAPMRPYLEKGGQLARSGAEDAGSLVEIDDPSSHALVAALYEPRRFLNPERWHEPTTAAFRGRSPSFLFGIRLAASPVRRTHDICCNIASATRSGASRVGKCPMPSRTIRR